MEEKNELQVVDMEPEVEIMEEDNSTLVTGLIGIGIGIAGTLLAKKGVGAIKKAWKKRKVKKVAEEEETFDDDFEEEIEDEPEEKEEPEKSEKRNNK